MLYLTSKKVTKDLLCTKMLLPRQHISEMYTERKVRQSHGACCLAKEKKGEEWAPWSGSHSLGRKKEHQN